MIRDRHPDSNQRQNLIASLQLQGHPLRMHVCHVWSTVCELVGEFLAHKMPNDGHNDEHHASNVGFGAGNKLIIMSKNVKMNDEQLNDA